MSGRKLSLSAPDIKEKNEADAYFRERESLTALSDNIRLSRIDVNDSVGNFYDSNSEDDAATRRLHCGRKMPKLLSKSDIPYLTESDSYSRPCKTRSSEVSEKRKKRSRGVFKNGDCNVVQVNVSERRRRYLQDIFTTLVDAQWRWTFLTFAMSFFLSWFIFAIGWSLIAYSHGDLLPENRDNPKWTPCVVNVVGFTSAFLYSLETQHSTGYGARAPTDECPEAVIMLCLQSIIGVMIQAFMVGIVFAKMARPKQRTQTLLFSKNSVVCQRDGELCLLFRVGDMREKSHLINSTVRFYIVMPRNTREGELLSPYVHDLEVTVDSYDSNILLIWPMTVAHKIDEKSPLYEMTAADLLYEKFELIVILEGTTESTGQTTQARTSYLPSEILWGHRFQPLVKFNKDKSAYEVDYALFHNTYQVDTPLCSAQQLKDYVRPNSSLNDSSIIVMNDSV